MPFTSSQEKCPSIILQKQSHWRQPTIPMNKRYLPKDSRIFPIQPCLGLLHHFGKCQQIPHKYYTLSDNRNIFDKKIQHLYAHIYENL